MVFVSDAMNIAIKAGSISIDCPHATPIDNFDKGPAYELAHEKFAQAQSNQFNTPSVRSESIGHATMRARIAAEGVGTTLRTPRAERVSRVLDRPAAALLPLHAGAPKPDAVRLWSSQS